MSTAAKPKQEKASWSDVKKSLAGHSKAGLLGLIADLYDYSAQNRNFLHARFSAGADPLKPYKKIIGQALYPNIMKNDPVRIAEAKRAIADYKKAIGDQKGLLELMLFFVETGTEFTVEFGDMDENFYLAHELMFKKAVDLLLTFDEEIIDSYYNRFEKVVSLSDKVGWGYHDTLADIFYEAFPDEDDAAPQR